MNVLVIIPARGGSKGVPRKNLRDLAGKPLIYYSIDLALKLKNSRVIVNTDDDEIEYMVRNNYSDVEIYRRPENEATDKATIDDVIFEQLSHLSSKVDTLIVLQPTSPLLSISTLNSALNEFNEVNCECMIAVTEFSHLLWKTGNNSEVELVQKTRVNRQEMDPLYMETGSFTITNGHLIDRGIRVDSSPRLFAIEAIESIDLDTHDDWSSAERIINSNKLYIYVEGNDFIGLGHLYNVLELVNYFAAYSICFLCRKEDEIARKIISQYNYEVVECERSEIQEVMEKEKGSRRLIMDSLDSKDDLLSSLSRLDVKLVSFEDRNTNFFPNRIIINALYSGSGSRTVFYGHNYFIMRREFYNRINSFNERIDQVLITFGGADPQNYTEIVYNHLRRRYLGRIIIVLGKANRREFCVDSHTLILRNISNMAQIMRKSDIVFTSAGRTSLECAAMRLPGVVLNQNAREQEHLFAKEASGFIRGKHVGVEPEELEILISNILDKEKRYRLWRSMEKLDFNKITDNTIAIIKKHIQ